MNDTKIVNGLELSNFVEGHHVMLNGERYIHHEMFDELEQRLQMLEAKLSRFGGKNNVTERDCANQTRTD